MRPSPTLSSAFTLVELLLSAAILSLLLSILISIVNQTSNTWQYTKGRMEQFRDSRAAFETITRRMSQATLNNYLDYVDQNGLPRTATAGTDSFVPHHYTRRSELRFISGPGLAGSASSSPPRPTHSIFFQAPLGVTEEATQYGGMENLLNTWGYYVEFDRDRNRPPFITDVMKPARYRFRLMELMEPSESLSVYKYTAANPRLVSADPDGLKWFTDPLGRSGQTHVLAENIVALVLLPKLSSRDDSTGFKLSPNYSYDSTVTVNQPNLNSKNQIPPLVQVALVAVDEASFSRSVKGSAMPDPGYSDLFKSGSTPEDLTKDLGTMGEALKDLKISYRVFTTEVSMKTAKWSNE